MWENDLSKLFSGEQFIILKILLLILSVSLLILSNVKENRTWQKHDERDFPAGKKKKMIWWDYLKIIWADSTGLNSFKKYIISHNKES